MPGGNALSAKNRVAVVLPPGIYDAEESNLELDTDYVDIVAQYPEVMMGAHADYTLSHPDQGDDLENNQLPGWQGSVSFEFPRTRVIGTPPDGRNSVIEQTVEDIRLIGFSIECYWNGIDGPVSQYGFNVSAVEGGKDSFYSQMTFYSEISFDEGATRGVENLPTNHENHFRGEWVDCIANDYAFRLENKTGDPNSQKWSPVMTNCHAGTRSFGGDSVNGTIEGAKITRCTAPGAAFGGCLYEAMGCDSDTTYVECKAVPYGRSFSIGDPCAGTFIRCEGGEFCVASTVTVAHPGIFSGYAEDCRFGQGSLGGSGDGGLGFPSGSTFYCDGTIVRCRVTDSEAPIQLQGAEIRDSYFGVSLTNIDGATLLDGNSVIAGTTIEVDDAGTGIPINAGSAQNVVAVNCTFNNGDNDADGLGANITNLALTPSNGIY
jgi:hypothetical protein